MGYLISVYLDDLKRLDECLAKCTDAQPAQSAPATVSSGKRRFEFQEGSSSKFWEIEIESNKLTTRWGKIGTAGQTKTLELASEQEAKSQSDKLVKEKCKKGYIEV